jgi:hypothetical protein
LPELVGKYKKSVEAALANVQPKSWVMRAHTDTHIL